MKIGFIGLGNMGAPMAKNLAAAGHDVIGFDVVTAAPDGVQSAETAGGTASDADVVITMLPNGDILRSVANDVIPVMKPGAVLLDCSTVDVESARAVASQATTADLGALDARFPVGSAEPRQAHSPSWSAAVTMPSKQRSHCSMSWVKRQSIAAPPATVRRPRYATI